MSNILSAREVSERLQIPLSTVYHLAKIGRLPAIQIGRSWRFPRARIEALLAQERGSARILVVDDEETTRTLVREMLEPRGYSVMEAGSVDEALKLTARYRFDAFLIDLVMPERSGTDLIRELLKDYPLRRMVVITASPDLQKITGLLDIGAVTIIRKPLEQNSLADCLASIVAVPLPQDDG